MNPFEFIDCINLSKKDVIAEDPTLEKDYSPFMVNRGLSYFYDTVMYANEMNRNHQAAKKWQFQFLLNSIRGYKRPFRKWEKRDTIDDLEAVREYYNYSYEKAKEVLVLLDATQLETIRKEIDKGGLNDSKPRRVRGS